MPFPVHPTAFGTHFSDVQIWVSHSVPTHPNGANCSVMRNPWLISAFSFYQRFSLLSLRFHFPQTASPQLRNSSFHIPKETAISCAAGSNNLTVLFLYWAFFWMFWNTTYLSLISIISISDTATNYMITNFYRRFQKVGPDGVAQACHPTSLGDQKRRVSWVSSLRPA